MNRNEVLTKCLHPALLIRRLLLRPRQRLLLVLCASGLLAISHSPALLAGPRGGEIVVGDGQIVNASELSTLIQQNTDLMAIDWRSFNIDPNEIVKFVQPGRDSIALNRVLDNKATTILGRLEANGQLFLVNSRGIVFGKDAVVNVGGLLATDLDIDPNDFAAGKFQFKEIAGQQGAVINRGIIQAAVGGSVTLLGHVVRNEGKITAELGRVQLASGAEALVTLDERGLIGLQIQRDVYENLVADDSLLESAAVSNSGTLSANGGQVLLKGEVTRDLFTQAVNNTGIIEAKSIDMVDGEIVLSASEGSVANSGELNVSGEQVAGSILIDAENIVLSGRLDAAATEAKGGEVIATASDNLQVKDQVSIDVSSVAASGGKTYLLADHRVSLFNDVDINASGARGGGEILVGGDYAGAGEGIAARNSATTVVDDTVFLNADALIHGDGGKVVLWSDGVTYFGGTISARGGLLSGDGGFVETSGKETLYFRGDVSTFAENGAMGELLLDPYYIIISDTAGGNDGAVGTTDGQVSYGDGFIGTWTISDEALESVSAGTNITLEAVYGITIDPLSDDLIFDQTGSVTFHAGRGSNTLYSAYFTMDPTDTIQMTGGGSLNIYVENQKSGSNTTVTVGNIISDSGSVSIDTNLTDGQLNFGTMNMSIGDITINNADVNSDFIFIRANQYANGTSGDVNLTIGDLVVNGDSPITVEASPLGGQDLFDFGDAAGNTAMNLGNVSVNGNADIIIQSLPSADSSASIGTTNLALGNVAISGSGNISIIADNPDTPDSMDALQISAGNVSVGGNGDILLSAYSHTKTATRDANILVNNVTVAGNGDIRLAAGSLSTMSGFSHDTDNVLIRAGDVTVQGTGDIYFLVESNDGNSADSTTLELRGASYSTSGIGAAVGQGNITFEDNSAAAVVKNLVLNPTGNAVAISTTANGGSGSTITIDPDFTWTGNNKDLSFSSGTGSMNVDWADLNAINVLTLLFSGSLGLGSDTSGTVNFSNAALINFGSGSINTLDLAVTDGITAADVNVASLPLVLNADSDADGVGTFTLLDNAAATDFSVDSGLNIIAADIDLQGVISTGSSLTLVASDGQSIGIGAGGVGFDVSQTEINNITATNLNFETSDDIVVNADVAANFSAISFLADSDANAVGNFTIDTGFTFNAGNAIASVNSASAILNGNLMAGANDLNMVINNDLTLGGGVQIRATSGSIVIDVDNNIGLAANALISSNGGNVAITADADNSSAGAITMDQTAAITASVGKVSLSAYDDIVLGLLSSGFNGADAIVVDSTSGAIESADTSESVINLTANSASAGVRIEAGAGIGATSRVNTDTANLAFDNSDSGNVHIKNTTDLQIPYVGLAQNSALNGSITVESLGDLVLATPLSSNGGNISLLAANNVALTADASLLTNNGAVVITADSNGSGLGAITVPTTATVAAGSGSITFNAYGDITVTGLSTSATGNAVVLSSSNGAIIDGGDVADLDINASTAGAVVTLSAATGVGAGDALTIDADTLSVDNGSSGAIEIIDPTALTIAAISNSSTDLIDLSSSNDLTVLASGGGVTTAGAVTLGSSTGSLIIDDNVVSAAGNIVFDSANRIDMLSDGVAVQSGGGTITLRADNDVDMAGAVSLDSSAGNILIVADDNADNSGFITMGANTRVNAGAATISLTAYDDISLTGLTSAASGSAITVTSTGGAVNQSGDVYSDIVTSDTNALVTLNAFSGIGSFVPGGSTTDPLILDTAIINAQTSSGDIALNNLSSVQVDAAVSTAGGDIYLQSGGDMLISATGNGVSSAGGDIYLETINDGHLSIANDVSSAGGAIVAAAQGNFDLQANAHINSANGSIALQADSDADNNAANTMIFSDGSHVNSGSGVLSLSSDGDILLAHLQTTNASASALSINSRNGAIVDNGDTDIDIDANTLGAGTVLSAATGIGAGNALEIAVYELDSSVNSGDTALVEADDIRVNTLRSLTAGALRLDAGGALDVIASGNGVSAASADAVLLSAGSEQDLTLGQNIVTAGGGLDLRAENDVLIQADINSGNGNVVVTADSNLDASGLGGEIVQLDGTQLQAGSGTLALHSDGDITLANITSSNATAAAVVISSGNGAIVDAGDSHVDIDANSGGAVTTLNALQGIGSGNALEVNVASLDSSNASGATELNESDGLVLLGLRNLNSGLINLLSGGYTEISSSGSGVSTGSADSITIDVTGESDLAVNAAIASAGGAVTIAAEHDVHISDQVASNGGDISVTADSNSDATGSGGVFTQADGSRILADVGTIQISADGDIALANLSSANSGTTAITVSSANGAIVDGGDSHDDVTLSDSFARLTLSAAKGIGVGNALELNVSRVHVSNAVDGEVSLLALNALDDLQAMLAGTGDLSVISQGDIVFGFGSSGLQHSGSGGINLYAQNGSLYINGPVTTQGGGITMRADQDIQLSSTDSLRSAGGDIQLLADANGDGNGAGGDVLLADTSIVDTSGGALLLSADALVRTGVLSNIGDFESYATRTEVAGDLNAQSVTQTGTIALAGNVTSTMGGINLGSVEMGDLQQIHSASDLLIDQIVLPASGAAIDLHTANDGDVLINSFQISAASDVAINSEGSVTLGDLDLLGGQLSLLVDSNDNEAATVNLQSLSLQQLQLNGSAASDDQLLVTGVINSDTIVFDSWDSVSVAGVDAQSTIYVDANQINVAGDLLSGGMISLLGAISLQNDVIVSSAEYAQGGVVQIIGSVAGNQHDLTLDAGTEHACACDADINDVANLTVSAGEKLAVNNVRATGTVALSADQEVYIKGAVDADALAVNADANGDGDGIVFLGSDSSVNVNSDNLGANVLAIDSALIDCGPALAALPELPNPFDFDEAEIRNGLDVTIQESANVETMAKDNQFTTKVEVSYIKLDCIASDDSSSNSSCREKKSLHDFLGTFLINHQVPES